MYVTRGMKEGHPKGEEGYHASCVRPHLHSYISFHVFIIWYFVLFAEICICIIMFNTHVRLYSKNFWNNPIAEAVTLNAYICLQGRGAG